MARLPPRPHRICGCSHAAKIYGQLKCGQCGTMVFVDQARYVTAGGTPLCEQRNLATYLASAGDTSMAGLAVETAEQGGALALRRIVDDAVNYAGIPREDIGAFTAEMGRYEEFGSIEEKAGFLVRTIDEWKARYDDGRLPDGVGP